MIKKKFKIYYTYIDTDISDLMAGEKSQEEIVRALSNYPTDLQIQLNQDDEIKILEQAFSSKFIVVEVTSSLAEPQFMKISESVLKNWLLLAEELKE